MPIARINGQGIFYEDSGGEGTPLVFMHGFLFDQSMFDAQVAALAPTYRCIRFDARAFGQTEWDGQPFDLYDTVEDCIGLMDYLGIDQAVLVGMSQGGYASLRVAVKYPHRVKALVFLSTYNGIDPEEVKNIYRSMRDTWVAEGPEPLLPTYLDLFVGQDPQLRQHWNDKWKKYDSNRIVHGMNNLIDRTEVTQEMVNTVTMPALVVHGGADTGMPAAMGEALYKSLPNAVKFVVVEGAPHAANVTHPDEVNTAMLEFLAQYA